jgi:hypothetical protein
MPGASEHDNFSMRHKLRRRFKKTTPLTINQQQSMQQLLIGI